VSGNIRERGKIMATIYDVAREAGVSHTTVSRVINRKKSGISISEETRKKVMEAAARLNYVPSRAARNLSTGQTNCFCFLLCDRLFTNLYYYSLLKVIEEELSRRGMGLLFAIYKENEDLPPLLKERAVDGIFVTGRVTQEVITKVQEVNVPFVVLGKMADKECEVNQVQTDVRRDIISVYDYLIRLEHNEIAYISDYKEELLLEEATEGCKLAYEQHDLEPRTHLLRLKVTDPYITINEVIDRHPQITAFIIQNIFAGPFIHLARERSLDIPDKVSVIMFNDEALDDSQRRYFTYFPGGTKEMGKEGVKSLIELSRGKVERINITISNKINLGKTVKDILG
jgi:LacI family transcriptional regulator